MSPMLHRLLHDPAGRRAWRMVLAALLAAASWLAFMPQPPGVPGGDKLHHLLGFAVLTFVGALGYPPRWRTLLTVALALLLYGAFVEAVQSQLPWRSAEWADLLADGLGVLLGATAAVLLRRVAPTAPV
jgi:VanZ family protein